MAIDDTIKQLKKIADNWPDGISLFSAPGSLLVINKDGLILDRIFIPNDGGDPVTEMKDGKEYIKL